MPHTPYMPERYADDTYAAITPIYCRYHYERFFSYDAADAESWRHITTYSDTLRDTPFTMLLRH